MKKQYKVYYSADSYQRDDLLRGKIIERIEEDHYSEEQRVIIIFSDDSYLIITNSKVFDLYLVVS